MPESKGRPAVVKMVGFENRSAVYDQAQSRKVADFSDKTMRLRELHEHRKCRKPPFAAKHGSFWGRELEAFKGSELRLRKEAPHYRGPRRIRHENAPHGGTFADIRLNQHRKGIGLRTIRAQTCHADGIGEDQIELAFAGNAVV